MREMKMFDNVSWQSVEPASIGKNVIEWCNIFLTGVLKELNESLQVFEEHYVISESENNYMQPISGKTW